MNTRSRRQAQCVYRSPTLSALLVCIVLITLIMGGGETISLLATPLAVPPLPATFYGSVTAVDGNPPVVGATVTAWINGAQVAATITVLDHGAVVYQLNIPGDDPDTTGVEGGHAGEMIQFQINDQIATPIALWQSGAFAQLNLRATTSTPTPTPTGSATVTPTPTGSSTATPTATPTGSTPTTPSVTPTLPTSPNLILTLDATPPAGSLIGVDSLITYTFALRNQGNDVHTNLVISAVLPADAAYLVDSAVPKAIYTSPDPSAAAVNGGGLTWTLVTLNPGASFLAQFTVRMMAATGNTVTLAVKASSDQTTTPISQSISHRFSPTALEDDEEPAGRHFFFMPILLR